MFGDGDAWTLVLKIVGAVTAILIMLETIRRVIIRPMVSAFRFVYAVVQDVNGTPGRDGYPGIPGLMEIVTGIVEAQKVQGELQKAQGEQQNTMAARQENIEKKVTRLEYHTGNGHEPSLRSLVIDNTNKTEAIAERLEVLEGEREERLNRVREGDAPPGD